MATLDTLVTDVQSWTGETTTTLPNATAAECVNRAIRRLQRRHGYQGTVGSTDLTIGTQGRVPLPFDYVAEIHVWQKNTSQSDPARALVPIMRTLKEEWYKGIAPQVQRDTIFPNVAAPGAFDTTTNSYAYFIEGGMFVLVPTPTSNVTVQLDYVQQAPELVHGTGQTNWFTQRYPDVVREGALAEAYKFLHEWDAAALHEQAFTTLAVESIVQDEAPTAAGPRRSRGN